jgi:hypothetical protein
MLPTLTQLRKQLLKFRCYIVPNTLAVYRCCYPILVPKNADVAAMSHGELVTCRQGHLQIR